ncbi:hypothetical protein KA005_32510 [bacterium]|nr:hypothetical protein [bacterium]
MDERLIYIVDHLDELCWFDRKYIWWMCFKHKHGITVRLVVSLLTAISIGIVLSCEKCPNHAMGLLILIVLLYFYAILIDYLIGWGKRTIEEKS